MSLSLDTLFSFHAMSGHVWIRQIDLGLNLIFRSLVLYSAYCLVKHMGVLKVTVTVFVEIVTIYVLYITDQSGFV